MIQLNNKLTGHYVVINHINIDNNTVLITEFENKICELKGIQSNQFIYKFNTINLKDYLKEDINYYNLCFTALIQEKYTDFEISNDELNWLFPERKIRVTLLNSLILANLAPLNAGGLLSELGQLIERVKLQHYGFYKDNQGDATVAIYFNTVAQSDYPIILPFLNKGIYIENL